MIDIESNLAAVLRRIEVASVVASRQTESVTLVAVSKKKPVEAIEAAIAAGQQHFGENFVQEAVAKIGQIRQKNLIWHYIGSIQSNKTHLIASTFDWVHSIDRLKIAQRLSEQRPAAMPDLNICIQVNIDAEPTKSGIAPTEVVDLVADIADLPRLRLRGLMAVPSPQLDEQRLRDCYHELGKLLAEGRNVLGGLDSTESVEQAALFDQLSIGMSRDLEAAIECGATMVRVGSDIFGAR